MKKGWKATLGTLLAGALAVSVVAGCGGSSTPSTKTPGGTSSGSTPAEVPAGYPTEYQQIVADSKRENSLLIYSNMAEYNWKAIVESFNKRYPWIQVQTLDLGSGEVFERYLSEKGSGAKTADLLVSASPDQFIDLVKTRQEAVNYESPEQKNLPQWALPPLPGLYTVSADPLLIIYNKALLKEDQRPTSMTQLTDLAQKNPTQFKGKITTYDITSAFGYAANWAFVRDRGEKTWQQFETFGPMVKPEKSGGPQVEKVISGEYVAGYFVSGIQVFPKVDQAKEILGYSFPKDGTPMFLRGVTIPKAGKNVNSAKLMLDFLLSHDGQVAVGKGGLVPYRSDVKENEVPRSFQTIVKELGGEDKLVFINYDEKSKAGAAAFQQRWKTAFKR